MKRKASETYQLRQWRSRLGDDYLDRNPLEDWMIGPGKAAFQRILKDRRVESILEVGSSAGRNLMYLNELLKGRAHLYAVEPGQKAFSILTSDKRIGLKEAWNCSAFELPLDDRSIDLVFTSGVLIHISPEDLGRATDEIHRVARKYILCIEYFSHKPESAPYRGRKGLLFKRDFGGFYLERYSDLRWVDYGFLWQREFKVFDNLNWWLLERSS